MLEFRYRGGGDTRNGVSAETTYRELEKIRAGGMLNPETVWKKAQSKSSPLHPHFTWDLQQAAEKCWTYEARQLIKLVFVVTDPDTEPTPVFYNTSSVFDEDDTSVMERGYVPFTVLGSDSGELQRALEVLRRNLEAAQRAVEALLRITSTPETKRKASSVDRHIQKAKRAMAEMTT